ncbi:hypothetical protein [Nocardia sp. NPDC019395]|uniref:hypothetical protein n=1 Tax=Nocardia sp. NPDC019395 TaxID=3154686 RepID=UPI0033DFFBED
MTTTANGSGADPGARDPGNGSDRTGAARVSGGAGLVSPKGFGWFVIATLAGLVYGIVARGSGCPMAGAAGAGVAAGVAVLYWLEQFDWHDLLTTRRGWILLVASCAFGLVATCVPVFTVTGHDIWVRIFGVLTAAAVGFGGALGVADHFVGR